MGVFLAAEVEVIRHAREQVADLGFFGRVVGKMTFLWRGPDQKLALALEGIPEATLDHSVAVAKWLVGSGGIGLALAVPALLRLRWRSR